MDDRWVESLADALGVTDEIDEETEGALLDVARAVAHTVERRAAPLTTFVIGLAAVRTEDSVEDLCAKAVDAARDFGPEE
ncbi:MAG TPA: DUF6457 domain-containing protein [Actinomycetota bacterium]|nr:DUF6457 domain-containing protein [Actinomycetota bacterium]